MVSISVGVDARTSSDIHEKCKTNAKSVAQNHYHSMSLLTN